MNERTKEYSNVKEITGDIIEEFKTGDYDLLAHGCNCFHKQKSGVAGALAKIFPKIIFEDEKSRYGDATKLGDFYRCKTIFGSILGIYSQYDYGYDKVDRFQYESFRKALRIINFNYPNFKIIMPKIGAGLAGGDWDRIKQIIVEELKDLEVTVCHLNP